MKRLRFALLFLLIACSFSLCAQDNFYDPSAIQEIRMTFSQANWMQILDSLFIHVGDNGRLTGNITINGQSLKNVGVRYKGYSSWNQGAFKNPFNIDLDYTVNNQNYQGYTKLKLSNIIDDPSFVREVLSYEIARNYMPASRANFANVYVNDSLIGLYTNVEAVDKHFVKSRYGTSNHSFFKGEPDTLVYPFGENANLAYTHGNDSSGYIPYYNMESKHGWKDLFNFIRVLNNPTDSIGYFLNIDRALWMHAFNYSLLNLDSYIGFSQNYYIYKDNIGRFNPISWDLNMSFGSFRESDGSYNFLGISIPMIKVLDPLEQLHFSVSPRPLMTGLFRNDTLKRMYLAHMRTIIRENFINNAYYTRAKALQAFIDASVQEDLHKFYSYQDFVRNVDTTVGGSGSMILYPGLRDLIEARVKYLLSYPGFSGEPVVSWINHTPQTPVAGTTVWISARVSSANRVFLAYRFDPDAAFIKTPMSDDGNSHDRAADDSIYAAALLPPDTLIQYYIYAENDSAGSFSPERAEYEYYTLQRETQPGELVINEIMASGENDPPGENSRENDWIEIFNTTSDTISLKGFSLLLEPADITWYFPDTLLGGGKYLVIWADGAGGNHAGFTLPEDNGMLVLSNPKGVALDTLSYGWQVSGESLGRYPNGYGPFEYMEPSPGKANYYGTTPASGFRMYPCPARDLVTLEFKSELKPYTIEIANSLGQQVMMMPYIPDPGVVASTAVPLNISNLRSGLYTVKLISTDSSETQKLIIY